MKKCSSCGTLLDEGYCLTIAASWPITVTEKNRLGKKVGDTLCYICPNCQKIELYLKKKQE